MRLDQYRKQLAASIAAVSAGDITGARYWIDGANEILKSLELQSARDTCSGVEIMPRETKIAGVWRT